MIFKKPKNALEGVPRAAARTDSAPASAPCPRCRKPLTADDTEAALGACPYCRHHFPISPRLRLALLCDGGAFDETDAEMSPRNTLGFPGYDQKLLSAALESGERDAVVCGTCAIAGRRAAVFVMNQNFMMGSMGAVVGEKITRLFELAARERLPVIGFTVSGGARMQEGIISLMQMAKTCAAVRRHGEAGLLYICVLTDPTTGGVTASFGMAADIILAEPFARIAFAGPRVIEQTIRKKLPAGFQRAEFLIEKGFIDRIVDRRRQRACLAALLKLHGVPAV